MHATVTDLAGSVLLDGDIDVNDPQHLGDLRVPWIGAGGDQDYDLRDIAVWVEERREDRPDGFSVSRVVFVAWTDDTDTDPANKGKPADVRTTVEAPLPGGGIGPFVVAVE